MYRSGVSSSAYSNQVTEKSQSIELLIFKCLWEKKRKSETDFQRHEEEEGTNRLVWRVVAYLLDKCADHMFFSALLQDHLIDNVSLGKKSSLQNLETPFPLDTLAQGVAVEQVGSAMVLWPSICWCRLKVGDTPGNQPFPSSRIVTVPCKARKPSPSLRWAANGRRGSCHNDSVTAVVMVASKKNCSGEDSFILACLFLTCTHPEMVGRDA